MTLYSTTIAPNSAETFPNQCMSGYIKNLGSTTTTKITIISEGMATLKKSIAPLQSFNFTNLYILKLYNQSTTNALEASFSDSTTFAVSENPYAFSQVGSFEVVALGVTDINIEKISSTAVFNVTGAVAISGGITINSGTVTIGNTVNILGAVSISAGTVTIGNTVNITGLVSISAGTVSISGGTVNIGNTVNILGAVSISAGTVDINGTVNVNGIVGITGNVSVTATGTVTIGNTVNIAGAVSITAGSVTIGNTVNITGAVGISAGTVDINGTVNVSLTEITTSTALNTAITKYLNTNKGTTITLTTTAATALPSSTVQHFQIRNGSTTTVLYVGAENALTILLFPNSMFLWDANPNETTQLDSWYVQGTNGKTVIVSWQV